MPKEICEKCIHYENDGCTRGRNIATPVCSSFYLKGQYKKSLAVLSPKIKYSIAPEMEYKPVTEKSFFDEDD